MDVKILPLNGCLQIILAVFTLGLAPLLTWLNERGWPKSLDEQGLTTRGGRRIAWSDFTRITEVVTRLNSGGTTVHYELKHPQGKVVVAVYRLQDGQQVFDYIWQRLPERAKKQ